MVRTAALDRGFDHTVHHHHDDAYAKESVIGVAIVAGIVRKSKAKEMIAGIAHSTAVYVLDVFLLREDEDKPMKEYYEYDQGECEKTYANCGPGAKQPCFMRHKEAIRISSLLPPARFTLVNSSPRAARSSAARGDAASAAIAASAASAASARPARRFRWTLPAGARQEALGVVANDANAGIV